MGSGQITKIRINLDLIELFQFSLKIYNLWSNQTYEQMYECMGGLMGRLM